MRWLTSEPGVFEASLAPASSPLEQGIYEAREAGRALAAEGIEVDECHTSFLRRAVRSACLMLSTLGQCWVPSIGRMIRG